MTTNSELRSTTAWISHDADRLTLMEWLKQLERHIQACDMDGALPLFHHDMVGFGSRQDYLLGRTAAHAEQWTPTGTQMDDYHFNLDRFGGVVSEDRCTATIYVTFGSTGYREESGEPFDRPGRATFVLIRPEISAPWRAVHTHVSLKPGTPIITRRAIK